MYFVTNNMTHGNYKRIIYVPPKHVLKFNKKPYDTIDPLRRRLQGFDAQLTILVSQYNWLATSVLLVYPSEFKVSQLSNRLNFLSLSRSNNQPSRVVFRLGERACQVWQIWYTYYSRLCKISRARVIVPVSELPNSLAKRFIREVIY